MCECVGSVYVHVCTFVGVQFGARRSDAHKVSTVYTINSATSVDKVVTRLYPHCHNYVTTLSTKLTLYS